MGSYAASINVVVVGVVIPDIALDLGFERGGGSSDWVVTGFLLGVLVGLPVSGWLADRLGQRSLYIACLAVFAIGATVSALSPSIEVLVVGRVVQGLGGGALTPLGLTIIYSLFPSDRRGFAIGIWGAAVNVTPAVGPPLGGWVAAAAGWRWIFWMCVIIAVVGAVLSFTLLPEVGHRETRSLDLVAWVLLAAVMTLLVVGLRQATEWGLTSTATLLLVLAAIGASWTLVARSLRQVDPLLDLRAFSNRTFTVAVVVGGIAQIGQIAYITFVPIGLQVVRGLSAGAVGFLLVSGAVGMAAALPVGGWLTGRTGPRGPAVTGLTLLLLGALPLAVLKPDGPIWVVALALLVQGTGLGLIFVPTQIAAMASGPEHHVARISAVIYLTRQLASAIGVALMSAALVADLGAVAPVSADPNLAQVAYNRIFVAIAMLAAVGVAAATLLPSRRLTATAPGVGTERRAVRVPST